MGVLVIDSSALLALLFVEKDAQTLADHIAESTRPLISAASYLEAAIVFDNRPGFAKKHGDLDRLISSLEAHLIPFDQAQALEARQAHQRFGKGRHPAKLNMGDCFAYALAKQLGVPLLYKGDDFAKTDVLSVI